MTRFSGILSERSTCIVLLVWFCQTDISGTDLVLYKPRKFSPPADELLSMMMLSSGDPAIVCCQSSSPERMFAPFSTPSFGSYPLLQTTFLGIGPTCGGTFKCTFKCKLPSRSTRSHTRTTCASASASAAIDIDPTPEAGIGEEARPFVIGLNQYSHDTGVAMIDCRDGQILYALGKERLTRRKHDGGEVGQVVEDGLQWLANKWNTTVDALTTSYVVNVIANNHHFRIRPFEERIPFQVSLNYLPSNFLSPFNLLHARDKYELSHHLAHAFSAIAEAPFESGLVVVMDGMGDALDDWLRYQSDPYYFTEISSHQDRRVCSDHTAFREFPPDINERVGMSFREAETAYVFRKRKPTDGEDRQGVCINLLRVYKRWTAENAPSELLNHSFEEMDSVGAMYSRVSAIIFKDWNNCGKVMGLAPYGASRRTSGSASEGIPLGKRTFMHGELFDGSLEMTQGRTVGLDRLIQSFDDCEEDTELRQYFEDLAYAVQSDLEEVVLNFIDDLVSVTSERNVVFCGGVAQNSSLNGKLANRDSIDQFHVSAYPGDEGIAIGCAAFGVNFAPLLTTSGGSSRHRTKSIDVRLPIMPFFGRAYTEREFYLALNAYHPWLVLNDRQDIYDVAAERIVSGDIVAWFSGRSECGARALGHRSLLGRATSLETRDYMNDVVKRRESFRPLAPAVLSDSAYRFFSTGTDNKAKECRKVMAMTCSSTSSRKEIEGVVHVDGSARIQTVSRGDNSRFYRLIKAVEQKSGVPAVLNTSFNVAGEPMVESPLDAIRSLLTVRGISMLVICDMKWIARKREFKSIPSNCRWHSACIDFRISVVQRSDGECSSISLTVWRKTSFSYGVSDDENEEYEGAVNEQVVELDGDLEFETFQAIHNNEGCTVDEIVAEVGDSEDAAEIGGSWSDQERDQSDGVCGTVEKLFNKLIIYPDESVL